MSKKIIFGLLLVFGLSSFAESKSQIDQRIQNVLAYKNKYNDMVTSLKKDLISMNTREARIQRANDFLKDIESITGNPLSGRISQLASDVRTIRESFEAQDKENGQRIVSEKTMVEVEKTWSPLIELPTYLRNIPPFNGRSVPSNCDLALRDVKYASPSLEKGNEQVIPDVRKEALQIGSLIHRCGSN